MRPGGGIQQSYLSTFVMPLIEDGRWLDDVCHLHAEHSLLELLGISRIPSADALGDWLRRMGREGMERKLQEKFNTHVFRVTRVRIYRLLPIT